MEDEGEDEGESNLEETEDPEEKPGRKGGKGGRRKETANDTKNQDSRARSQLDPKGKILFQGYGSDQPKPDRDSIGKTTVDIAPGLTETRQQATEALRQQKVPQQQRDMVSEFYKNLVQQGDKKAPEPKK